MSNYCVWCGKKVEDDELLDCGNEDTGYIPYHEDCFYEARDKTGQ